MERKIWTILGIVFSLATVGFLLAFFRPWSWRLFNQQTEEVSISTVYQSPLDWKALKEKNSDIIGWLEIPVSDQTTGQLLTSTDSVIKGQKAFISYPVLQHPTDDAYYLDHDENGLTYYVGALFTEKSYNRKDFSDPCVAIYGHHVDGGNELFTHLERTYGDENLFKACQTIKLYLPDQEKTYKVFAAVPFDNRHILYSLDFNNSYEFTSFVNEVRGIRDFKAQFDDSISADYNNHILILSTCLIEDPVNCRFLVIAVEE